MKFLAPFLVALPLACAQQNAPTKNDNSTCQETHIFIARGWNEPYPGRQESFLEDIATALSPSSSDYEDIVFHSTFEGVYCDMIFEGVANGLAQLKAYNKRCPKTKLVVSGYSQGAYIVGDMFAGGGGTFGDCTQGSNEGLDPESDAGKMVTAVLMWGSKRHTASQPYNTFTGADKNGTYPRKASELEALKRWTPVLSDYCVVTDPNCAGGKVNEDHWNYFELYSDIGAEFVKKQVENDVTAASPVEDSRSSSVSSASSTSSTSSAASSSAASSTVTSSASPATTSGLNVPSAASTADSSATSTSSSGSATSTSYQLNLVGLAIAGSLIGYM